MPPLIDLAAMVEGVLAGDVRCVARAISVVENGGAGRREVVRLLHPSSGRAHIVGVTGPPGVGKSTLVDGMIAHYRASGHRVGAVAVDPTSPFTGGAILGDRIRMVGHSTDAGVFVRSMGSRGSLGGLASATADVVTVLDAAGFDVVIVETVGAGQAEVDIVTASHTTVVVEVPGLGDDVQVLKAGVMEIGDVFAVNKADMPDADRLVVQIESVLRLKGSGGWVPPVVKTIGHDRASLVGLMDAISRHRAHGGGAVLMERRRGMAGHRIRLALEERLLEAALERAGPSRFERAVESVVAGESDPYSAVDDILGEMP
ncbi:MAG: methylmalonyl Co-A mutase-associated GTPase MeaB [Thermoplasmata archaeon]|nr:methylmalonyl Co-A mutase-associated GTPase MeaB [Thermoplasmata archaeon]